MASGRRLTVGLLALLLPILLTPSVDAAEGVWGPGTHLIEGPLVVGPDDVLVLAAGASFVGNGSVEVLGRLDVRGEPGNPAQLAVPVRLLGGGNHSLVHARVWGVEGAALTLSNGSLRLDSVLFEASATGLLLEGAALAEGRNVSFRGHASEAVLVGPLARVVLEGGALEDNAVGARVLTGGRLVLDASLARDNGLHVDAQVGSGFEAPRVVLRAAELGRTVRDGPAVRVAGQSGGASAPSPALLVEGGRIDGAAVGVQASDARIRLDGARLEGNRVGLSLAGAFVELKDVHLGNARDIDGAGSSQLHLENVTYASPAQAGEVSTAARVPGEGWPAWVPWLAIACVAVLSGAILWNARPSRVRAAEKPAPVPIPIGAPPPVPEPPADAPADDEPEAPGEMHGPPAVPSTPPPLGPQERRILEDVLAHPDTAQAAVAERIGLTRQAVHYHVKKLEARGLLAKSVKGRETQCRLTPAGEAAVAANR